MGENEMQNKNPNLTPTGKEMLTLMKLSMDSKIQEQLKFIWEDEVFINCLKGFKSSGMPLPEKVNEVQALIRLILAASETSKVKRLLDYQY